MEAYAAAVGAYPTDLFLCTLINAVMSAGISLFLSAFMIIVAWIMAKENHQRGKTLQHASNFVAGNVLRVWALLFTPLALSAMYQLTLSTGTLMTAISSVSILLISVAVTIFMTWRILRASTEKLLFEDLATLLKYGPLYNTLAEEGTLFFLVTLLVRFLWGLVITMLSSYGVAQVAVLMVVELGYMMVIGVKWPYWESGDNKFHLFLGCARIIITGCSIAYVHDLNTSPEIRQLFGYIQMALHLAILIVMFALVLWNTIQVIMFWRSRHLASWRGPIKSYRFENPVETEHDWVLTGRPLSTSHLHNLHRHQHRPESGMSNALKARRYTVQPYVMMGDIQSEPLPPPMRALDPMSEERFRRESVAYRQSQLFADRRRSRFPPEDDRGLALDIRPESNPRENHMPNSRECLISNMARSDVQTTKSHRTKSVASNDREGFWTTVKGSIGNLFNRSKGTIRNAVGDGTKPKAFE
ncbi:hypothetical protein BGW38_007730, partial [Lunasporangiospora selenospora]